MDRFTSKEDSFRELVRLRVALESDRIYYTRLVQKLERSIDMVRREIYEAER